MESKLKVSVHYLKCPLVKLLFYVYFTKEHCKQSITCQNTFDFDFLLPR